MQHSNLKKILQYTWQILERGEKKRFLRLLLPDILVSILDILSLAMLVWIIRFYVQPAGGSGDNLLPAWLSNHQSTWLIGVFLLFFALKNLAAYFLARAHHRFSSDVAIRISHNNLVRYQQASFADFIQTNSSIHIRRISYQPFEFCQHILAGLQQMITQVILVLVATTAILIYNATLFLLVLLLLLPPVLGVFVLVKKKQAVARKNIHEQNERSFRYLYEALKGWVEGNIYHRNEFFLQRFIRSRTLFSKSLFTSMSLQSLPSRVIEIFAVLGLFLLILLAGWMGNSSENYLLTIGAFMAASYRIIPGLVRIINTLGQMKAHEFALAELAGEGNSNRATTTPNGQHPLQSLELDQLGIGYNSQRLFHSLNLRLERGDFLGISAPSGRGKTTLLNVLLGFMDPEEGRVLVNDQPAAAAQLRSWWPRIAYVRQQPFLIHDSLLRNITLSENGHDPAKLEKVIQLTGLNTLAQASPDGLHKKILEDGKNISGGQQQRIALARALYKDADLLLLDEPFSELDPDAEQSVLNHLCQEANQGRIIILITHNQQSLSYCNRILKLDEQA